MVPLPGVENMTISGFAAPSGKTLHGDVTLFRLHRFSEAAYLLLLSVSTSSFSTLAVDANNFILHSRGHDRGTKGSHAENAKESVSPISDPHNQTARYTYHELEEVVEVVDWHRDPDFEGELFLSLVLPRRDNPVTTFSWTL